MRRPTTRPKKTQPAFTKVWLVVGQYTGVMPGERNHETARVYAFSTYDRALSWVRAQFKRYGGEVWDKTGKNQWTRESDAWQLEITWAVVL